MTSPFLSMNVVCAWSNIFLYSYHLGCQGSRNCQKSRGCFTNVSRALQNNLAKIHNTGNHIYGENFKLKLCTCAQNMALGTRTKFQLEILMRTTISTIHKFQENILESSLYVSETTPRCQLVSYFVVCWYSIHGLVAFPILPIVIENLSRFLTRTLSIRSIP